MLPTPVSETRRCRDRAASGGSSRRAGRVGPEDVLRAVAVMDVEVDDRDALGAMLRARIEGGDGGVVEQAEAHGAVRFRVMAGRAHWQKAFAASPAITASTALRPAPTARSAASQRAGRDDGVGVELLQRAGRARRLRGSSRSSRVSERRCAPGRPRATVPPRAPGRGRHRGQAPGRSPACGRGARGGLVRCRAG